MHYEAVIFDLYGTLIDIHTDERRTSLWRRMARFLRYQGVYAEAEQLRELFFAAVRYSQRSSPEPFPEVNLLAVWRALLSELGYRGADAQVVPIVQLFRALSMRRFSLFADTRPCLETLRPHYTLGVVSDAQRLFLEPEMAMLGLAHYFDTLVVSSDFGYRKPDARLFGHMLETLSVPPARALYVGDNPLRDISGARNAGMAAVLLQRPGVFPYELSETTPDATIASLRELPGLLAELR